MSSSLPPQDPTASDLLEPPASELGAAADGVSAHGVSAHGAVDGATNGVAKGATNGVPNRATNDAPSGVRHRTERDASGRVWRFVYDPAAQSGVGADVVRLRCTTGTARAALVVPTDWYDWPRQQLLGQLEAVLQRARGHGASAGALTPAEQAPERTLARRRLVRNVRGLAWNCVYDPMLPAPPDEPERVRVRCVAGRERIELTLDPAWHRLGDRQLAVLIEEALDARG